MPWEPGSRPSVNYTCLSIATGRVLKNDVEGAYAAFAIAFAAGRTLSRPKVVSKGQSSGACHALFPHPTGLAAAALRSPARPPTTRSEVPWQVLVREICGPPDAARLSSAVREDAARHPRADPVWCITTWTLVLSVAFPLATLCISPIIQGCTAAESPCGALPRGPAPATVWQRSSERAEKQTGQHVLDSCSLTSRSLRRGASPPEAAGVS